MDAHEDIQNKMELCKVEIAKYISTCEHNNCTSHDLISVSGLEKYLFSIGKNSFLKLSSSQSSIYSPTNIIRKSLFNLYNENRERVYSNGFKIEPCWDVYDDLEIRTIKN